MNPILTYNEIFELIDEFDLEQYAKTRNHLQGAVSRLSPYITRGVISLPAIRTRVLQKYTPAVAEKFLQELAWREYFQKVFSAKGELIFSDLRFSRVDWHHHEVVSVVAQAQTGIAVIDNEIKKLFETGYMHNHARMWTAMLACNVAKAHWYNMSRWMYYHLIDGDLASNMLSWQWVAGTSVQKQYVANQKLINACSDTKQTGTYLDIPREMVGGGDVPVVLQEQQPFTYSTKYPKSNQIESLKSKNVFLYHPWSIDPLWRADEIGERILVIEPRVFDRFPVSEKVVNHMLTLLHTHIPTAKVFVGNVETVPDIGLANVFSKSNPATTHFPGDKDSVAELFPAVQGYHQSFFSFWKACQKESNIFAG